MDLSVVIPVRNEANNVAPLLAEIRAALDGKLDYEVIYVDDGSDDDTVARVILGYSRLVKEGGNLTYNDRVAIASEYGDVGSTPDYYHPDNVIRQMADADSGLKSLLDKNTEGVA